MRVSLRGMSAATLLASISAQAAVPLTEKQSHCVAWKARKTMFLVKEVEPVGVNCGIAVSVGSGPDGKAWIQVRIPIKGFDSGSSGRDEEVAKILKSEKQSDLLFKSETMNPADWRLFLAKPQGSLKGTLSIGGEDSPVEFKTVHSRTPGKLQVEGSFVGTYGAFKMVPPVVGGGAIAKAADYLELHFRFQSDQVSGSAALFP